MSYPVIFIVLVSALVLILAYFLFRPKKEESLNLQLLLIELPKEDKDEEKEPMAGINLSEQLFASLLAIKKPFVFEASVHNAGGDIFFYLAVPREMIDFATRQIQGLFPDAKVSLINDYTIFNDDGGFAGANITLKDNWILPIRTYEEAETDTFSPVVNTLSKLQEVGDGATIQLVVKPVSGKMKDSITGAIERIKKGEKLIRKDGIFSPETISRAFFNSNKKDKDKQVSVDEEAVKALYKKASKSLLSVNIRLITSSGTKDRAEDLLLSIGSAFSQFGAPLRNDFKVTKVKNPKNLIFDYVFRKYNSKTATTLNTEELASIFHLPTATTNVPRIKWLKTKEAPAPDNLPTEGVVIGESIFRDDIKTIRIAENERRRHFYTIGQTGTGKSFLMLNMAIQDIQNGKGICMIDPHGELIDKVLSYIPAERADDVIVFDPGDTMRPLGLNMLEFNSARPEEKTFIVNEMQSIFNRLFDKETMGPMFEQYMRNALLLLMEDAKNEPATLMEVPRIFTDEAFRNKKLARITNPTVIDFWTKEAAKATGDQGLSNMAPYITSKFGNFIVNDYMRPIIGQTKSAFNFRQVMDDKKILLVNLSKGRIGDINAGLLGMVVTARLLLAALSRVDIEEEKRNDFYLYIDEFQNFTTDSISVILSEARKYRLNLTLAHQFIAQLSDEIREAVFGNVGSMSSFRVGPKDAEFLVKHFGPQFSEKDLISVENQHAFAKILINGEPSKPFNFKTIQTPKGSPEIREKIKELSRLTYGADASEVERSILTRLRG